MLAGTSRPTVSAYEHGRKSPTLATVERIVGCAGFELAVHPKVTFTEHTVGHGRPVFVADRLWRLSVCDALATVELPLAVNWSQPSVAFRLADRRERARCYEIVLREGQPEHLAAYIDGALLVDGWPDIVLPRQVRALWQPLIDDALGGVAQ